MIIERWWSPLWRPVKPPQSTNLLICILGVGGGGGQGKGAEPEPGGPLDVFGLAVFLQRAAPIGADLVRTSLDESGPGLAEFSFACKSLQQSRRRVRTSLNESGPGLAEFSFACKSLQQQQS